MTIRRRRRRRDDERGIVIIYFAMMLVVLLLMSGFAVDVGAWYKRGQEIQRAADAAALAGVVYMPGDFATASLVAKKVATANGFTDCGCTTGVHVTVSSDPVSVRRLQVTIKDDAIPQYFTKVAMSAPNETRSATGEYVTPVPMGSPENSYGTDNLSGTSKTKPGFFAAVDGWCSSKEDGDRYETAWDSNRAGPPLGLTNCYSSSSGLTTNQINSDYIGGKTIPGYIFDIEIPGTSAGGTTADTTIQIYDASYVEGSGGTAGTDSYTSNVSNCGPNASPAYSTACAHVTTYWRLLGPDTTPFDNTDNPQAAPTVCTTWTAASCANGYGTWADGDTSYFQQWKPLTKNGADWYLPAGSSCIGAANGVCTYRLVIFTKSGEAQSWGTNTFAVRANNGNLTKAFAACTTIGTGGANNSCPDVHAEDSMSIFVNDTGAGCPAPDGTYNCSDFYLAKVGQEYAGKTLKISLFDPGEGAVQMRVLNDANTAQTMTWDTKDYWYDAGLGSNYSGSGTLITGFNNTISPSLTGHSSSSQYNDRVLQISIAIPSNYKPGAQEGWWKVRYEYSKSSTSIMDHTTWSISLSGNPVHLVS